MAGDRWYENGRRRFRQAMTEAKLAAKLAKVTERLRAEAPDMERPGADLIAHYLDPDRLPVGRAVVAQARRHPAQAVRAVRRPGHRARSPARTSPPVTCSRSSTPRRPPGRATGCTGACRPWSRAGIEGGYLTNPRLREVHWQAGDRPLPEPQVSIAGESALWVDPAEIPAETTSPSSARPWPLGRRGELDELMANIAAYSRAAAGRAVRPDHRARSTTAARVITVDRKVVEVAGHLYVEAPKCRKFRSDHLPRPHPGRLPARRAARRPHRAGPRRAGRRHQPARADLPLARRAGTGGPPTSTAASWHPPTWPPGGATRDGNGAWTWHSLRHVFCTTALFAWKLDATDVSRMAGHANYRITLDMYVGTTAGVLDRARQATE